MSANTNTSSKTKPLTSSIPPFVVNSWITGLITLIHLLSAYFFIYLVPFGRGNDYNFTSKLYDLIFIDKLQDINIPFSSNDSFIGPILISILVRPLNLVFDEKVLNFLFAKFEILQKFKMFFIETKIWNFIAARIILSSIFVYSLQILRVSIEKKFKSPAISKIFASLSLVTIIPLLSASSLSNQTFTMILLTFSLAALFDGKLLRAASLLTLNFIIFDSIGGFILLQSFLISSLIYLKESTTNIIISILLTIPFSIIVSFAFDSIYYNKFIWPQGELIYGAYLEHYGAYRLFNWLQYTIINANYQKLSIYLIPALGVFLISRSNRFARLLLIFYSTSVSLNILLLNSIPNYLIIPFLLASSISVLNGTKSFNKIIKSSTVFVFIALILPGIFFTFGRLNLEIANNQQFTANSLIHLNHKIIKESQAGIPTRILLDSSILEYGYSPFIPLNNVICSLTSDSKRPISINYFIGSCPGLKALKYFKGFKKIDTKSLTIVTEDRVGIFRSPFQNCLPESKSDIEIKSEAKVPSYISKKFFNGKFSSLKEQEKLISNFLSKFNHKKISNSIALILYIYANILEQI